MVKSFHFKSLLIPVLMATIAACSHHGRMEMVKKELQSGRLVSAEVVQVDDFLNGYQHHLPVPTDQILDVHIASERGNALASGDRMHLQVALVTRQPRLQAGNFHFLMFNPRGATTIGESKRMTRFIKLLLDRQDNLPMGSSITVDWVQPRHTNAPALLADAPTGSNLVTFLRQFARLNDVEKHHFILVAGDKLVDNSRQRINAQDLVKILRVKNASFSVIGVGNRPHAAFFEHMANTGAGRVSIFTEDFSVQDWLQAEIMHTHTGKITDISVSLIEKQGSTISMKSPQFPGTRKEHVYRIGDMVQGEQYVILLDLKTPALPAGLENDVLQVNVDYRNPVNGKFVQIKRLANIATVAKKTQLARHKNPHVERSLLILDTRDRLREIVPYIRQKRYYYAIALLTQHHNNLKRFNAGNHDAELKRDEKILSMYTDKLYKFDEKFFQGIRIWKSMSWEAARFK